MSAAAPDPNRPPQDQGESSKRPPQEQGESSKRPPQEQGESSNRPPQEQGEPSGRRESLKQVIARRKREMKQSPQMQPVVLMDPYANACASNYISRRQTAFIYDKDQVKHYCEWDKDYPECPDRANVIIHRLRENGLIERCLTLPNYLRPDLYERIVRVHTHEHYEKLKNLCNSASLIIMEHESTLHDSVYFNQNTFNVACRAASATLNLVMAVANKDVQNGMAIVRPPGHHAMRNDFNGYCFFNNVAIAAEAALKDNLATRVLIVDIDIHHGQGTQQIFYNRKDVLYFSIHRYEHGTFWPNLLESNFNYIGKGEGLGYNINVPLNTTGLADDDYIAIVCSILLPVAYEYNPDLILVSAGYDAVIGCPEGRMNVTPGFYAHLITLLSALARGQIAVILEGGYFLPTLAEGAFLTLKALLGGPCPILDRARNIHPTVIETICNVRRMLLNRWNCFKHCETIPLNEATGGPDEHKFIIDYLGRPNLPPYQTKKCYPQLTLIENNFFEILNRGLREKYRGSIDLPVCYVYDEAMLLHKPPEGEPERPERPERLTSIIKMLHDFGLDKRMLPMGVVPHDIAQWSPHKTEYLGNFHGFVSDTHDIYVNEFTHNAAMVAVSALMTVVDVIMDGKARSGIAIVRPPGHHAEHNRAMGFCFVNNVAVAALYLRDKYNMSRVLIVDFDIHHGNGTQNIFYPTDEIMYISIHRDEEGRFFPAGSPRDYTNDGYGVGQGFNINIPFNKDKMGDTEYLSAFHNIILPAAYAYGPKVILISAGFDAGINDPLGGYHVNPETFGHFIQMLKPLAEGRLILSLEGGYNLTTTSYAMAICAKALVGDPIMMPRNVYKKYSTEACKTIANVTQHFKQYFNIFQINKKLSLTPYIRKRVGKFTANTYNIRLYKQIDMERVEDSEYVEQEVRRFNARDS